MPEPRCEERKRSGTDAFSGKDLESVGHEAHEVTPGDANGKQQTGQQTEPQGCQHGVGTSQPSDNHGRVPDTHTPMSPDTHMSHVIIHEAFGSSTAAILHSCAQPSQHGQQSQCSNHPVGSRQNQAALPAQQSRVHPVATEDGQSGSSRNHSARATCAGEGAACLTGIGAAQQEGRVHASGCQGQVARTAGDAGSRFPRSPRSEK